MGQEQIDREHEAFLKVLPDLLDTDLGRFALIYGGEVIDCFDDFDSAYQVGLEKYGVDSPVYVGEIKPTEPTVTSYSWEKRAHTLT